MVDNFGTLKEVALTEVWPTEDGDFTPWLHDNLGRLGEIVGLDLEPLEIEAPVGRFALDLLARDVARGHPVAIENQYGRSNHDHFGKLLTYAAGYDAGVAIWVAESFTDEHRAALEWMNRRSSSDLNFFGVTIKVLQIDDSLPVPVFTAVVAPIEFGARRQQATGRPAIYQSYFQKLIDQLREEHQFTKARKGQPQNWYSFGSGVLGVTYNASFTGIQTARVEVYIDSGSGDHNKLVLDYLHESDADIERVLGTSPEWADLPNARACRIYVERHGTIDASETELDTVRDWMVGSLLKFREAFGPRLRDAIDAAGEFDDATAPVVVQDDNEADPERPVTAPG